MRKATVAESLDTVVGVNSDPSSVIQPLITLTPLENWPVLSSVEGAAGIKS